ncbi:MAG: alanine racemase [Cryomorphaceae bacterium]|nr:alanine racemase [Flavobacteriales bacterium]
MIEAKTTSSHIELSEDRLGENIDFVRSLLKPDTRLSAVIKGNAYGHGIKQIVPMAERAGIDHFSVYGVEEAAEFQRSARPESGLMIMGYIDPSNLGWVIEQGFEFFIYDLTQLKHALAAAKELKIPARIHIELETGMNRTGFDEVHLDELSHVLKASEDFLRRCGICTHLAGAESLANHYRIKGQLKRFDNHLKYFKNNGVEFETRHVACSAGVARYPESHFDMVRVGILLYGFWPSLETLIEHLTKTDGKTDPITSVLTWKSQIMTVKKVKSGEYIGYGSSFMANREMTIAIVPVGYAYGYTRSLSNQGRVLIHGKRVGVIGTVNMNMMAIDVTEINNVANGDEVVLIGTQGENRITVASFGEMSSQMNYELLARLPHNLPRIIK